MPRYEKPYKTFDEQLNLIEARGLSIKDRDFAKQGLVRLGYYRLSGYWYPFRVREPHHREGIDIPENQVVPGHFLDDVIRICDFDSILRNLILAAVEQTEVALRVAVAYEVGKHGPLAYLDPAYWGERANCPSRANPDQTQYEEFCAKNEEMLLRSKEKFAEHFRDHYGGDVPVWAAIELWDYGTLSRFYQVMAPEDRQKVAHRFNVSAARTLQSWISALNDLRNFCAHHQRLNRRHFPLAPRIPRANDLQQLAHVIDRRGRSKPQFDKELHQLYPIMCVLSFLLQAQLSPVTHTWRSDLVSHFLKGIDIPGLSLSDYGIPENWTTHKLWMSS